MDGYKTDDIMSQALNLAEVTEDNAIFITQSTYMYQLNEGHSFFFGKLLFILIQIGGILNETDVIEYVKENSTTVLECPFKGIPGSISWLRYNNDMSELITEDRNVNPNIENIKVVGNHTIGEYNLELQRATKADEKIYKCVSNMNENLWVFEISVRLSTSNDEIKITNVSESNAVVGVIGISLTLKCISEHQYLSNISWSTNGNILCENHGNESAYEFIPREEHQNAIYTCTAVYIGKEIRKSVWLNLVPKSSELYISTILETTKGEQETIAESSEKNHTIVTTVAIILVTAGILIAVYSLRNKGTENNSIMRDVNVAQEAQPGAQGNVQHNQNSSGLVYIEVDFEPKQEKSGPKLFYVHGSNNRSPYADIDFSAKADPLPESESDDNEIEEDDFVTLEDVKGWAIEISE